MRHGAERQATEWMRRAVTEIDFSQRTPVRVDGGWEIYVDPCLSMGWVSSDQQSCRAVFGPDTWNCLQASPPIYQTVIGDVQAAASGLKMLNGDVISKLVRVQELGVQTEDEVVRLEKMANQLILESASLNMKSCVSALEISQFTLRSGQLQEAYQTLKARVDSLGGLIEASTDSVETLLAEAQVTL